MTGREFTKIEIDCSPIPRGIVELCRTLQQRGFAAFVVGGGVRDLLIGRPVTDWDVATAATPQDVQHAFRRTIPTGIRHGTVTVLLSRELEVEVTTFRGEFGYSDGRHPDRIAFVQDLEQDLRRRDFTINAMAIDPVRCQLHDPLGGRADLARGVVRAVGEARDRFSEDGLRPMRAVRFAAVLELDIDPVTFAAIPPTVGTFRRVSGERVRDELIKLLRARSVARGLGLLRGCGLFREIFVGLESGDGPDARGSDAAIGRAFELCDGLSPRDPMLRLAGVIVAVMAAEGRTLALGATPVVAAGSLHQGSTDAAGGEAAAAAVVDGVASRLTLSGADRARVKRLVCVATTIDPAEEDPARLRRWLRSVGPTLVAELLNLLEAVSADDPLRSEHVRRLRRRLEQMIHDRPPLELCDLAVDGMAVANRLGVPPGPVIGQVLRHLLEIVLDDPSSNNPATLLAAADAFCQEPGTR